MLKNNNVNVRALGLLYIRVCLAFEDVYAAMKGSFNDKKMTLS